MRLQICYLDWLPYELVDMICKVAIHESPVYVHKTKEGRFELDLQCTIEHVCWAFESKLEHIQNRFNPWMHAQEIKVDVYNLDFRLFHEFLGDLTSRQIADFKERGTKITPELRFGQGWGATEPRNHIIEVDEDTLDSLVDWVSFSADPEEPWDSFKWSCGFAVQKSGLNMRDGLGSLEHFAKEAGDIYNFPGSLAKRREVTRGPRFKEDILSLVALGRQAIELAELKTPRIEDAD